uniref:Protein CutA n=1 Tax=Equus caballus TaxID=9796 RepID=A0A9L0SEA1_HORSE
MWAETPTTGHMINMLHEHVTILAWTHRKTVKLRCWRGKRERNRARTTGASHPQPLSRSRSQRRALLLQAPTRRRSRCLRGPVPSRDSGKRRRSSPQPAIGRFRFTRKRACHFCARLQIRLSIGQISPALLPQQEAGQAGPREGRDWLALEARGSPVSTVTWCALFSYHVPAAQHRLHAAGAGFRNPARRRGEWPAPPLPVLEAATTTCAHIPEAALLLSLLWMPVLLPGASRLLLLPRALLSMASGSPPSQPSQASGSGYVPGSVSAAFVTCPNEKVAKEIARAVVEKHLAACVNLIPKITSIYEWKGKIEEDSEVLMMIKTQSSLVPALTDFVRSVHPYEVAEVIALPVEQGNIPYLNWVRQVTVISDSSTVQP